MATVHCQVLSPDMLNAENPPLHCEKKLAQPHQRVSLAAKIYLAFIYFGHYAFFSRVHEK